MALVLSAQEKADLGELVATLKSAQEKIAKANEKQRLLAQIQEANERLAALEA